MADRKDRLTSMTGAGVPESLRPTERLDPVTPAPSGAARRQALLYAPPPAVAAPYVTILESEGIDVLVANSMESAVVLLQNGAPAYVFALIPMMGDELRDLFRKYAPAAEVRTFAGLASLLQESVASPAASFDFAVRAIAATAGVLSSARGTPRERTTRILTWAEKAAAALGFTTAEVAATRLAAALYDVPGALASTDPAIERDSAARQRDREMHRALLVEFLRGIDPPFAIDDSAKGEGRPGPIDVAAAAADYALLAESRDPQAILSMRKRAAAGELHPIAAEAVIGAVIREQRPVARGKVLIVDGDAAGRTMLALRLANEGYETDTAADGRAALDLVRRARPSLILSETVLAGMDGFSLLDALRREGFSNVPFVFLSSRNDALSMNKGLLLGAADFLAKPINNEVLMTKLQKLLGQTVAAADASSRLSLSDLSQAGTSNYESVSYDQLTPGVAIMGRFRLLADLGEGGMGKVFKARDERLEEDVVIKVMKDSLTGDPRTLSHFKREIRLARKISHRAVVRIFDFWEAGPLKFVTMEYLQGTDLAAELKRRGAFPPHIAVRMATQFFEGLAAAHDLGVVHRDIKPHNVFHTGGHLKILDFGIAQGLDPSGPDAGTATQSIIGTPDYMSPEQLLGQKLDARTDLYSAGIMFYELLTAALPFAGEDRAATITARLHRDPEPPSRVKAGIPAELDRIVLKLLARSRDQRYPTAGAVITELEALQ